MPQILFTSASAGTGSAVILGDRTAADLVVHVPVGATTVELRASLTEHSSSAYNISGYPLSGSNENRQPILTAPGLYFYPNVGGLTITTIVSMSVGPTVTVAGNVLLKR